MVETEKKFDLFKSLTDLSLKKVGLYSSLDENQRKEFLPVVVTRWLAGTKDSLQIILLNEYANPYIFSLYKHKELLSYLLIVSSAGYPQRYTWLKGPSKKGSKVSLACEIVAKYYGYSNLKAMDTLKLLSQDDIIQYAEQLGYQADEISKVKKELKAFYE